MTKDLYLSLRSKLDFSHSLGHLFLQLAIDAVIFASIVYLIQLDGPMAFMACVPIALFMLRNVSVMHEAVHGLSHPSMKINYVLGVIAGSFCLLPFHLWKKIHLEHHFWAGNFNRDPSLEIIKRYPKNSPFLKKLLEFTWKTRLPLMAFAQYIVFWAHSFKNLINNYKEGLLWFNMVTPVMIWSAVLWKLHGQQYAVLGASIFIYLVIFEVINFPHHVGLYLEDSETAKRPVWQQYEITRTSLYQKWIEKLAVLNFNYHAEHHLFPDLPWHQLPLAHMLIQQSSIKDATHVVEAGWLKTKRDGTFVEFLRPDLAQANDRAPNEEKKIA